MTKNTIGRSALTPSAATSLARMGADLALARARRGFSLREAARRLYVSINTVRNLEQGKAGVSLGILANAMTLYGMLERLAKLADPAADRIGLSLERRKLKRKSKAALTFDV